MPNMNKRLTTKSYWDDKYVDGNQPDLQMEGFRNNYNRNIYARMLSAGIEDKRVLEIGAGDSQWLPFLAKKHPGSSFTGLDYSIAGCDRLAERSATAGLDIDVVCADMFDPTRGNARAVRFGYHNWCCRTL